MLFHSSVRGELARSFGATLIVLVTVVMTMTLIRTIGLASRGSFNPSDVVLVMGYTVLAYMPTILTMSLFIAIISSLSRMYRDSEMVIWFGAGLGLWAFVRPLFRFAWPVLLAIVALALLVLPWCNLKIETLKQQYELRGDLERMEPGQFQESANGRKVFFAEKSSLGKHVGTNVFIATAENGHETITSARSGQVLTQGAQRLFVLENGQRLERTTGQPDIKLSEFQHYSSQVSDELMARAEDIPVNTRPTLELLQNPSLPHLAEISWRIGLILASFNFVILGVAAARVNPRVGRSGNVLFSLFTFVFYYNLLNLGQNWIENAKVPFAGYVLLLHGGALALGLLWLAQRHNQWHWRALLPARRASP